MKIQLKFMVSAPKTRFLYNHLALSILLKNESAKVVRLFIVYKSCRTSNFFPLTFSATQPLVTENS